MEPHKISYHLECILDGLTDSILNKIKNHVLSPSQGSSKPVSFTASLLTTVELANHFKISKSHIDKLRKKHKNFPTVKLDGAVRFNVKDVEDFFQNLNCK